MSLADAILDMIRDAVPGVTVYDGRVPDGPEQETPPERYVAVYLDPGTRTADNVAHESVATVHRWQTTCVAPDRGMAQWLADRVRDRLVDHQPSATGWNPGLIRHTFAQLPRPDEQVQERPVVTAVDQYALDAERLPAAEES